VTDTLGRQPIADSLKQKIEDAFKVVPEGKRGALLIIADEQGARAHVAAKLGGSWKVAAGAGVPWSGGEPSGWVGISGSW
jgi:DNA integrity scanning protein DisA with diadenylate cyclase activity